MFEKFTQKIVENAIKKIDLKALILKIYEDKKDEIFAAVQELIEKLVKSAVENLSKDK